MLRAQFCAAVTLFNSSPCHSFFPLSNLRKYELFIGGIGNGVLILLEVRCGTADKSHENSFFRYFASQVKGYFEKVGIDGILVGMPGCLVMGNLQMDALLITDSSLTIIDFKDYTNCEVTLPDEADFERGRWETNKGFSVKGGSSPNPYGQLMLQRRRLKEILDRFCRHKLADFDSGHISTMVCFSGEVLISGGIPGWAKLKFFIADSESFLQKLYDIANVRGTGLLSSDFATSVFGSLFESQPYDCEIKPSKPFVQEEVDERAFEFAEQNVDFINHFFASDADVLIVSSTDLAERRGLALSIQDAAHDARFTEAMILSSTKLAGDNLCGNLPLDGSLYSEIYDFSSRYRDKDGVEHIELAKPLSGYSLRDESHVSSQDCVEDAAAEAYAERSVFVVCESQLVSANAWLDGSVIFGSGRLLLDTLEYLSINAENNGKNKIVFIGDDCQLGSGSRNYSSMHADAYPEGVSVVVNPVSFDDTCERHAEFSAQIAADIRQTNYALLVAHSFDGVTVIDNPEDERSLIVDAANNWRSHKIVSYTNEQAKQLNLFIKRSVLHNGEDVSAGDVLVFNSQFEALACNPLPDEFPSRAIRNGEFAVVTNVENNVMQVPVVTSNGESESLTLLSVRFTPEGSNEEYEALIIREFLYASKAELSSAQEIALKVALSEMERTAQVQNPFGPGNPWFEDMLKAQNYDKIEDEEEPGKVIFRLKSNHRRLTPQERAYRQEILQKLKSPGTRYFLLANAAKARFGWALTAHKAQSYLWDEVTLSANTPNLGHHSEQYFRFLYTGASRARTRLSLVRWTDITPFDETTVISQPKSNTPNSSKHVVLQMETDVAPAEAINTFLEGLPIEGAVFTHVGSSNYQERFEITHGDSSVVVAFSYNKKREVGSPVRQKGDVALYAALKEAIASVSDDAVERTAIHEAYDFLESNLGEDARIKVLRCSAYRDELEIRIGGKSCRAVSYYNAKGLVSRLERQSGDPDVFGCVESAIGKKEIV